MCGLAGYVGPPRELDPEALLAPLRPRGPDGRGILHARGTAWTATLVHHRLAILDPTPAGAQPMTWGRTHALVFNGEIFNHVALRAELEASGERFQGRGDTEVLLRGLVRRGPAFLERLRGPFALALLDRRSGQVLLARDRLGVNPLYISRVPGGGVAFASTVRALESAGLTSREVDLRGLCGFLFFGSVPEPHTLTRGVEEVEPGTWRQVQPTGAQVQRRWWHLPPEDPGVTAAAAVAAVAQALPDALAAEQISDVPVAVLLSSGLDSTAVAALVARDSRAPVTAFTVGFPQLDNAVDESPLAAATARQLGLRHQVVHARTGAGAQALQDALAAQDLPSLDGVNTFLVSQAIRAAGFKVALSGLGGDELFLGYANRGPFRRLAQLPCLQRTSWLGRLAAEGAAALGLSPRLERAVYAVAHPRGVAGAYAAVRTIQGPARVLGLLHPDLRNQLGAEDLDPVSYLDATALPVDLDGALSRLELKNYLRSTLLKDGNTLSLAHGLELRVPFLDARLVETVLRIPGRLRAQGTPPKPLLRAALAGVLPPGVERRPKVGFVLPLAAWLREAPPRPSSELTMIRPDRADRTLPVQLAVAALGAWSRRAR